MIFLFIEMFNFDYRDVLLQSLRCFFQISRCFSDSPKGQKDKKTPMTVIYLS